MLKKSLLLATVFLSVIACKNNAEEKNSVAENTANTEQITDMENETVTDWEILFDGTSFENWRGYNSDEIPSEWSIENNAMVFTPSGEGGNNIITKETFTNFILSIEWKIAEGGNSGIFWGVHEAEDLPEPYLTGPEIQVLDDAKHPDSFVGEGTHKAGALYDMIAPSENVVNPAGEWNTCVIKINHKTNTGRVTLNGTEIVNFPVHGDEWDAMVENSKFKGWEGFGAHQTGHIGLQDHGDKVWFKNIKIKSLD